jgi:hypothetical protein
LSTLHRFATRPFGLALNHIQLDLQSKYKSARRSYHFPEPYLSFFHANTLQVPFKMFAAQSKKNLFTAQLPWRAEVDRSCRHCLKLFLLDGIDRETIVGVYGEEELVRRGLAKQFNLQPIRDSDDNVESSQPINSSTIKNSIVTRIKRLRNLFFDELRTISYTRSLFGLHLPR